MKLKILLLAAILSVCSFPAFAASTVVSGQVKDANGNLYANGRFTVTYQPGATVQTGVAPLSVSGILDATGTFTPALTLFDNSTSGSTYRFNICAQAGQPCFQTVITITGATQTITTTLTSAAASLLNTTPVTATTLHNQIAPVATPSTGNLIVYGKTSDKGLYYKDDAGTETGPLGSGGGSVTLNDVLDPTADKTFAMAAHKLIFDNAPLLMGVNDPAAQGNTGYTAWSLGTQADFAGAQINLTPLFSIAEVNSSAPTLVAGSGLTGATLAAIEKRTSGAILGALDALNLDAIKTSNLDIGLMAGVSSFVYNQGSGTVYSMIGYDSGVETDGGTVTGNITNFHVQGASNSATVGGFIAGLNIENQKSGTATGGFYAIKLEDQAAGGYAIKTGTGLVDFGDAVKAGTVIVADLPAAAAGNKGQMRTISDSTAIMAEGQTCVGGDTGTALAFSNGSAWKCF